MCVLVSYCIVRSLRYVCVLVSYCAVMGVLLQGADVAALAIQASLIATDRRAVTTNFIQQARLSPRVSSPRVSSPRVSSPRVSSPRVSSPRVSSPRVSSPRVSSPRVSSPRGELRGRVQASGSRVQPSGRGSESWFHRDSWQHQIAESSEDAASVSLMDAAAAKERVVGAATGEREAVTSIAAEAAVVAVATGEREAAKEVTGMREESPERLRAGSSTTYAYVGEGALQQTPRAYEYLTAAVKEGAAAGGEEAAAAVASDGEAAGAAMSAEEQAAMAALNAEMEAAAAAASKPAGMSAKEQTAMSALNAEIEAAAAAAEKQEQAAAKKAVLAAARERAALKVAANAVADAKASAEQVEKAKATAASRLAAMEQQAAQTAATLEVSSTYSNNSDDTDDDDNGLLSSLQSTASEAREGSFGDDSVSSSAVSSVNPSPISPNRANVTEREAKRAGLAPLAPSLLQQPEPIENQSFDDTPSNQADSTTDETLQGDATLSLEAEFEDFISHMIDLAKKSWFSETRNLVPMIVADAKIISNFSAKLLNETLDALDELPMLELQQQLLEQVASTGALPHDELVTPTTESELLHPSEKID